MPLKNLKVIRLLFQRFILIILPWLLLLRRATNGHLQKNAGARQINPSPNQLRLNDLKVAGMEPAGNVKWCLWSGIMTFRLSGLENTNVGS